MGSKETHRKKRQRMAAALRRTGLAEARVQEIVAIKRAEQLQSRVVAQTRSSRQPVQPPSIAPTPAPSDRYLAQLQEETYARLCPDDRRFRPTSSDSLTTGAGRATGITAKAIRRKKAVTRYEYDQMEQRA